MADQPPGALLFACNLNRVRSPMAASLAARRWGTRLFVDSCGLYPSEEVDPFAAVVVAELGRDLSHHAPKTFEALHDSSFDLVVSLTPEAHARALQMARGRAMQVEYWPTPDPTLETGSREQRLAAYRRVRDQLDSRLVARFATQIGSESLAR